MRTSPPGQLHTMPVAQLDMGTDEPLLSERRMDRVLELYQLQFGDACWTAMDEADPQWVEERYDALQLEP